MTESRPVSPEGPAPLDCPFCGEVARLHAAAISLGFYRVGCNNPNCIQPEAFADEKVDAIARWNRRPSRSAGSPETPRKPIGLTAATSWVRHEVEKLLARLEKVPRVDVYIDHAPFRAHVAEEDDPGGRYVRFADLCEAIGPFVLAAPTTRTTTNQEDSDRLDWLEAAARDWIEDFSHENGQYYNHCIYCEKTFRGHKRRMSCKLCSSAAASPEGSAGQLKDWALMLEQIRDEWRANAEDDANDSHDWNGAADSAEALRVALPALLNASRERDTERNRAATYWTQVLALEDVVANTRAQLTDARSRIAELEEKNAQLRELINGVHETNRGMQEGRKRLATTEMLVRNERDALRRSREQAIAAIEALPLEIDDATQSVMCVQREAVLSILRGSNG